MDRLKFQDKNDLYHDNDYDDGLVFYISFNIM